MKLLIRDSYKRVLNSQLGKDVFYVFIAQVVIMVSVFCINKIIGVFIGVAGFGLFSLIKRAGGALSAVQKGGITIALPRYMARFNKSTHKLIFHKNLLITSLFIVGGYTLFTVLLYTLFPDTFNQLLFQQDTLASSLILATFIFSFGEVVSNLIYSFFQGMGNFKQYNIVRITGNLLCLIFSFIFRYSVVTLVIGSYTALAIFSTSVVLLELKKLEKTPIERRLLKRSITTMFSYGSTRMGHELISLLRDVLPLSIILYRFDMDAVGLYSAALSIPLTISPVFVFTGGIFLQRVSSLYKERKLHAIKKVMNRVLLLFIVIAVLGTLFLIALRQPLIHLFYSSAFDEAVEMSIFFSLSLVPRAVYLLYQNPLDAISAKPYNLIAVISSTIVLLALLFFAATLTQCALAYLVSSIIMAIFSLIFWQLQIKKSLIS